MEKVPITRDGFHRLRRELLYLRRVVRPRVIEELQEARSFGVRIDNTQYLVARERHMVLQRKIVDLEEKLSRCEIVVGRKFLRNQVGFGSRTTVRNLQTGEVLVFILVGPFESDLSRGHLSILSPVGRQLMGCLEGDEITVRTPKGYSDYRVLAVET